MLQGSPTIDFPLFRVRAGLRDRFKPTVCPSDTETRSIRKKKYPLILLSRYFSNFVRRSIDLLSHEFLMIIYTHMTAGLLKKPAWSR